jgi:hypothetical protein
MRAVLLFAACLPGGGDDAVTLDKVGVQLPRKIGDIAFVMRQQFDDDRLGYGFHYESKQCRISVFVYHGGHAYIPDGKDSAQVKAQMETVGRDIQTLADKGVYRNVRPMKAGLHPAKAALDLAGAAPLVPSRLYPTLLLPKLAQDVFLTAGFLFDNGNVPCKSYALMTGRKSYFIKVRVTQYVTDGRTNDEDVAAFLTALAKQLEPAKK